jgi:hypothetical protein
MILRKTKRNKPEPKTNHECALDGMNPSELDADTAISLTPRNVSKYKNIDCSGYNACLDVAEKKDWIQFACGNCSAYKRITQEQRVIDYVGLQTAYTAAGYVQDTGNAHRVPGVKPGTPRDSKRRLPIIAERAERAAELVPARSLVVG